MLEEQRPREKAIRYGMDTLSDLELLMLVISSGTKKHPVDQIAYSVLMGTDHLRKFFDLRYEDLCRYEGISSAKALQILGGMELARRSLRARTYQQSLRDAEDVSAWFNMEYGILDQEHVVAVFLDVHLHIISHKVIFVGTLDSSQIHPRDIFREACRQNAHSLILAHNHPGGVASASQQDIEITEQLACAAQIMGIEFRDHLIVTGSEYFSFRKAGLLEELETLMC